MSAEAVCMLVCNTSRCTADGGYDSGSEEGDEPAEGTNEVKDDAVHAFTGHTGEC